ncbi:MAG: hypothetical protein QXW47_08940 [Candidatus Jordarchaeales archaeon]|nr:hypothetical protein [Candidatus Jordarchaeia archaeon]
MAARKYHLAVGVLVFVAFAIAFYKWYLGTWTITEVNGNIFSTPRSFSSRDVVWLTISFFLSLTGSEIADFDHAITWMNHRDWLTHSAIIPSIPAVVVLAATFSSTFMQEARLALSLLLAMVPLVLAAASHLLIDLFPSVPIEELSKKGKYVELAVRMADSAIRGMILTEFGKRMSGSYLIHFWWNIKKEKGKERRTLSEKKTKTWLVINGVVLIGVALALLARYLMLELSFPITQLVSIVLGFITG